eukprot:scaffold225797_cov22-Tisochrysis_lutea.AAC.1
MGPCRRGWLHGDACVVVACLSSMLVVHHTWTVAQSGAGGFSAECMYTRTWMRAGVVGSMGVRAWLGSALVRHTWAVTVCTAGGLVDEAALQEAQLPVPTSRYAKYYYPGASVCKGVSSGDLVICRCICSIQWSNRFPPHECAFSSYAPCCVAQCRRACTCSIQWIALPCAHRAGQVHSADHAWLVQHAHAWFVLHAVPEMLMHGLSSVSDMLKLFASPA